MVANHEKVILKLEKHFRCMGIAGTLTLSKDQQLTMMLLGIDMVLVLVPNS